MWKVKPHIIDEAFDETSKVLSALRMQDVDCEKLEGSLRIKSRGVSLYIVPKPEPKLFGEAADSWWLENEGGNAEGNFADFLEALQTCLVRCYENELMVKFFKYRRDNV